MLLHSNISSELFFFFCTIVTLLHFIPASQTPPILWIIFVWEFGPKSHFCFISYWWCSWSVWGFEVLDRTWLCYTLQDIREEEKFDGYYHNQFMAISGCSFFMLMSTFMLLQKVLLKLWLILCLNTLGLQLNRWQWLLKIAVLYVYVYVYVYI